MTPTYETLALSLTPPFAHVTLNRPAVKNAMNTQMVLDLTACFEWLHSNRDIRAVVLSGAGGTFCAGGDIKEMALAFQSDQTDTFAAPLDTMLRRVNEAPQVVIARVEGAALGGGFGLICVSDMVIVSDDARMGLPEVRLGLVPALISPYVIQRIGFTRARELMLTGRRFDGQAAKTYGIAQEAVPTDQLDGRIASLLDELRQCSPNALAACKQLLFTVSRQALDESLDYRARLLTELRRSPEGQEGMLAFVEKRSASWTRTS